MRLWTLGALALISAPAFAEEMREVERVRAHLFFAQQLALAHPTDHLSLAQLEARERSLEVLSAYRERGVFPKNRDFAEKTPYFVDADGTRCAMAELIHASGGASLVDAVASTRNNAYVRELAEEPVLIGWLEENGISVEEAAAIQPAYCSVRSAMFCEDAVRAAPLAIVEMRRREAGSPIYEADRVLYGSVEGLNPEYRGTSAWDRMVLVFHHDEVTSLFGLRDDGTVQLTNDPLCDRAARVSLEEAVTAWTSGQDCPDRLEVIHPGFATSRCFDVDVQEVCGAPEEQPLPQLPATPEAPAQIDDPAREAQESGCSAAGQKTSTWALLGLVLLWIRVRRAASR